MKLLFAVIDCAGCDKLTDRMIEVVRVLKKQSFEGGRWLVSYERWLLFFLSAFERRQTMIFILAQYNRPLFMTFILFNSIF